MSEIDTELLALYRTASANNKASLLLALSGLTESAFTALLSDAPAERKEVVLTAARKLVRVELNNPIRRLGLEHRQDVSQQVFRKP
jgi:hypothetical protein